MKCIYAGFSLPKLQSFFWKISSNSRLTRLDGFNNKTSPPFPVCSTWPSGKPLVWGVEGPKFDSAHNFFLFASFLFFFFFFHFRYNSFVMFLYTVFRFTNFLLGFTCRSPEIPREVLRFTYFYLKSESLQCAKVVLLKLGAILFYSGIHFKPLKLWKIYIYMAKIWIGTFHKR